MKELLPNPEARLLDLVSTLARKLAHDIRSPFSTNIGVLQLLVNDTDSVDPAVAQELLSTLLDSSREHLQYIDLLLYWTRLEIGEIKSIDEREPLTRVLSTAVVDRKSKLHASLVATPIAETVTVANADLLAQGLRILFQALRQLDSAISVTVMAQAGDEHSLSLVVDSPVTRAGVFPVQTADPTLPTLPAFGLFLASRIFALIGASCRETTTGWSIDLPNSES
jgi:K+-sensing histidine kinase KdpD